MTLLTQLKLLIVTVAVAFLGTSFFINYAASQPQVSHYQYVKLEGEMTTSSVDSVVQALRTADRETRVIIDVDSGGGDVSALQKLIKAYDATDAADVLIVVNEWAASAAASFVVHVKHRSISPMAVLMYHLPSHCTPAIPLLKVKAVCSKILPGTPMTIGDKWAVELILRLMKEAQASGMINQQIYNKIVAGEDVYTMGGVPQLVPAFMLTNQGFLKHKLTLGLFIAR